MALALSIDERLNVAIQGAAAAARVRLAPTDALLLADSLRAFALDVLAQQALSSIKRSDRRVRNSKEQ